MPKGEITGRVIQELTKRSAERSAAHPVSVEETRKTTQVDGLLATSNRGTTSAPQGNRKVLKGEKGVTIINEFKLFVKLVDSA